MKRLIEIPEHLRPFVVEQKPELYTSVDHESWRFIMRIGSAFFEKSAHKKYLNGLKETGISIERIPLISEMDKKLSRWGWRAVAVSGFIPPSVFLEFQSLGILAIACDMRKLEHLAYTPAPDIVHEAAGHAPIIADPSYRNYLQAYGNVARRAIFSLKDMEVYEAVRSLSELKEDPESTTDQINAAQLRLDHATAENNYVSEANQLTRMAWWTVEYGLIGDFSNPKIFGAGLLSSVSESYNCFNEKIIKIPFTIDCINVSYDITKPQPQLFVAPNFEVLTKALQEYENTMGYIRGGVEGLAKAKMAQTLTTVELDSGLQISGVLKNFSVDEENSPTFLKYESSVQLSYHDHQVEGHGTETHHHGFSTPIGRVRVGAKFKCASKLSESDLKKLGFYKNKPGVMRFESGAELRGVLISKIKKQGKFLILSFKSCTIKNKTKSLYQPDWGTFDLACGCEIKSVFGGAADRTAFIRSQKSLLNKMPSQKTNLSSENKRQSELYEQIASIRNSKLISKSQIEILSQVFYESNEKYPEDWLLPMNVLEIVWNHKDKTPFFQELITCLELHKRSNEEKRSLIDRGLALL
ncbi:MAG: aromatic amino acid hydroxylase [Xanthomonadaceae bacterium]|nr:aromatic amino acid hydroxylase [Xanthomonadaceae bacterium]